MQTREPQPRALKHGLKQPFLAFLLAALLIATGFMASPARAQKLAGATVPGWSLPINSELIFIRTSFKCTNFEPKTNEKEGKPENSEGKKSDLVDMKCLVIVPPVDKPNSTQLNFLFVNYRVKSAAGKKGNQDVQYYWAQKTGGKNIYAAGKNDLKEIFSTWVEKNNLPLSKEVELGALLLSLVGFSEDDDNEDRWHQSLDTIEKMSKVWLHPHGYNIDMVSTYAISNWWTTPPTEVEQLEKNFPQWVEYTLKKIRSPRQFLSQQLSEKDQENQEQKAFYEKRVSELKASLADNYLVRALKVFGLQTVLNESDSSVSTYTHNLNVLLVLILGVGFGGALGAFLVFLIFSAVSQFRGKSKKNSNPDTGESSQQGPNTPIEDPSGVIQGGNVEDNPENMLLEIEKFKNEFIPKFENYKKTYDSQNFFLKMLDPSRLRTNLIRTENILSSKLLN